jgi:tRNA modification GTPase
VTGRTYAQVLSGAGRGAVGVIRVRGPAALAVVSSIFQPVRGASLQAGSRKSPRFGRLAGDEVVALVLEGKVPAVEIQAHGGQAVMDAVLGVLAAKGVSRETAEPIEESLARAETLRVARILLDQAEGAFDRELREIRAISDHEEKRRRRDLLLERSNLGMKLETGWQIVLTGRPNVGKSRLLNALAGYDRAIVSPQAGTTRDVVTLRAAIDGWPVEIADTAGIREQTEGLESAGIERAQAAIRNADLVVLVLDQSEPLTREDRDLIETHPQSLPVANKCDLSAAWNSEEIVALAVSAETSEGLDALLEAISQRLVPNPPPRGCGVPIRPEQVERVRDL